MLRKLLFLSFIEGAVVMAAELCGARQMAPVFGASLYVWAAILGITLSALALGYFYGGIITLKSHDYKKTLFNVLNTAAIFVLLMPAIGSFALPIISVLPFLQGVIIGAILLLFLPLFLLGASSPLFIRIQTNDEDNSGKVSGTVYAVSTFGGIIATFLCGFYLIPETGLNTTLLLFGGILLAINFIVFRIFKWMPLFYMIGASLLSTNAILTADNSLMYEDGILGRLSVEDMRLQNGAVVRLLKINDIIQSEMDVASGRSVSAYIKVLDSLIPNQSSNKEALVLGLGAGLTSKLLRQKKFNVTGVEFDPRIIAASKKHFMLNPEIITVSADARYFINSNHCKYDLIMFDVFKAEEQPSHILTLESLSSLKNNLRDSGSIWINWHGYLLGPEGEGTKILYNTLRASGFYVKIFSDSDNEDHRNLIFLATLHQRYYKMPFEINSGLIEAGRINTDDLQLLEKYNALANKKWRVSYLKYFRAK